MTSLTEKSFEEADKSASSNTLVNTLADDLMCLGTALTSVRDRLSDLSVRTDDSNDAIVATLKRLEDEIAELRRAPKGFRHVDSLTDEISEHGMPRSILITGIRCMTVVPVRKDSVSDFTFVDARASSQQLSVLQLDADGLVIPTLSTSTPARRLVNPTTPGVTFKGNSATVARDPTGVKRSESAPAPKEVANSIAHLSEGRKWYVVSQGRRPGVYSTSLEATPQVIGISCGTCVRVKSKEDALAEYAKAYDRGNVQVRFA